jgi:hypothetical protein
MQEIPNEIKHQILEFLPRPDYIHPIAFHSKKTDYFSTLLHVSKLSKSWYSVANEQLWEYCVVDQNNIQRFVSGLLHSVLHDLLRQQPEHALIPVCRQQLKQFADMIGPQKIKIPEKESESENELEQEIQMDLEDIRNEFDNRFRLAIYNAISLQKQANTEKLYYGCGPLIKRIWFPSWDPILDSLQFVFPWIPNCNVMKFCHPAHGKEYIPTLRPNLILHAQKYFSQLKCLSVEDVDSDGWLLLIDAVATYGSNLKVVNLEACGEKDQFQSKRGLSTVFPSLPNLECIRLDGVPVGSSQIGWSGDMDMLALCSACRNLRAVSLDFCDVSMSSFFTIWNGCPNLEFLGLAGLQYPDWSIFDINSQFQTRSKLKTIRFVDCQVNDFIVFFLLM